MLKSLAKFASLLMSMRWNGRCVVWSICCLFALGDALAVSGQDSAIEQAPVWDCNEEDSPHVLWRQSTGGSNAGYLTVHGDRVLVTSNMDFFHDPNLTAAAFAGSMVCLDRDTGKFQWQAVHPLLERRFHVDTTPITSRPWVDQERVYYVSNRCELMCLDLAGFHDGENDGPYRDEDRQELANADIVWKIDMMGELGVVPRAAGDIGNATSSPLVAGKLVYCVTGNGVEGWWGSDVANPDAPSFIAVEKSMGKLAWSSNAPGANIVLSQWSSPGFANIDGQGQVIFPGGDGCIYGFEALKGQQLWKVDCNVAVGNEAAARNHKRAFCFSVPVVDGNEVYVGFNRGLERFYGPNIRRLMAIDLRQKGDVTRTAVHWISSPKGVAETIGPVAIHGGLIYLLADDGYLVVLDQADGSEVWRADLLASPAFFGGPVVHDGKVFVSTDDGVFVFAVGREKKCVGRYDMPGLPKGSPFIAAGRLFIATGSEAFSLRLPE